MTKVSTTLTEDVLAELDVLCMVHRRSRAEVIRTAVEWYARWADRIPDEDPREDEIFP